MHGRGGRGECQEEGRNGPVGRVAMSGPGGIHGVPRWVYWPARPQAVGVFRWADGQMGEKVGWVGGHCLLMQRDRIPEGLVESFEWAIWPWCRRIQG